MMTYPFAPINQTPQIIDEDLGINLYDGFSDDDAVISITPEKRKPGRPKKNQVSTPIITGDEYQSTVELNPAQSNEPFRNQYKETEDILNKTIAQIDIVANELKVDLDEVRSSKSLKRKYDYISMMSSSIGTMLNSKITAVREINSNISKCNDLELKRAKEINGATGAAKTDEQRIAELYSAFVSAPTAQIAPILGPSTLDMTSYNNPMIRGVDYSDTQSGLASYVANMSPEQRLMHVENDPNVKQVVLVDQLKGTQSFQMMNLMTGEILQGVPVMDPMFLQDTQLDFTNMVARNNNINETYPIVFAGQKPAEIGY